MSVTLTQLRKEAKALGMRVTRSEDGEYRIAFKSDREASAYYTDDAEDALGTMRAMHNEEQVWKKRNPHAVTGTKNPRPRKDTRFFQFANTIEYGGEKAVINSWSHNSAVRPSMMRQRREWAAKYPRAKVRTERMADADIVALVAKDKHALRSLPREIGEASLADEGSSKGHGARLAAKKKRVAKKASVTGNKNPRGPYIVRAHHENGTIYYLTSANKLSTAKKDAERYATTKDVERILNYLELRLPRTIKFADGVQA